jgi:hypothetical protein
MKEKKTLKKLTLNKETVANLEILSREAQAEVKGAYKACWENLWTAYYCRLIWTGDGDSVEICPQ